MADIIPFRRPIHNATAPRLGPKDIAGDLTGAVAGRAPHDFCLHLELSIGDGLSIASAPIWSRARIADAGFPAGPAVILFTGRDLDGATAFAAVSTSDWKPTILRLGGTPAYAFAERIHLLSWIGAIQPRARRATSAEIGRHIALLGTARRLGRSAASRHPDRHDLRARVAAALVLIAATAPDLFDGSRP